MVPVLSTHLFFILKKGRMRCNEGRDIRDGGPVHSALSLRLPYLSCDRCVGDSLEIKVGRASGRLPLPYLCFPILRRTGRGSDVPYPPTNTRR